MEPCAEISKIDYKLGQDNVQFLGLDAHNPVFVVSSLTIVAFVAGVLAFQTAAAAAFVALRVWLMSTFDWVFMGTGNLSVLFCLLLVVTPLGRVRLGGANARPDYSRSAWFAMLFAGGTGIGLMFFGVFLARISRGRTVRELIASVLIVPTLIAAIWMNAFGGTAVSQYLDRGHPDVIAAVQAQQPEIALFAMLETLPLANLTSFIGIVLVVVFFVTSSDSGSLVIDTHHGRRQAGHADRPARVLVHLRGDRCHRAAARWRPRGRAGGHPRNRPPLRAAAGCHVLQHMEWAVRKHEGQDRLTPRRASLPGGVP